MDSIDGVGAEDVSIEHSHPSSVPIPEHIRRERYSHRIHSETAKDTVQSIFHATWFGQNEAAEKEKSSGTATSALQPVLLDRTQTHDSERFTRLRQWLQGTSSHNDGVAKFDPANDPRNDEARHVQNPPSSQNVDYPDTLSFGVIGRQDRTIAHSESKHTGGDEDSSSTDYSDFATWLREREDHNNDLDKGECDLKEVHHSEDLAGRQQRLHDPETYPSHTKFRYVSAKNRLPEEKKGEASKRRKSICARLWPQW